MRRRREANQRPAQGQQLGCRTASNWSSILVDAFSYIYINDRRVVFNYMQSAWQYLCFLFLGFFLMSLSYASLGLTYGTRCA